MKKIQLFDAVVERQDQAINDRAQFIIVVGQVSGTHSECRKKAKAMVLPPAIRFLGENCESVNDHASYRCARKSR